MQKTIKEKNGTTRESEKPTEAKKVNLHTGQFTIQIAFIPETLLKKFGKDPKIVLKSGAPPPL